MNQDALRRHERISERGEPSLAFGVLADATELVSPTINAALTKCLNSFMRFLSSPSDVP